MPQHPLYAYGPPVAAIGSGLDNEQQNVPPATNVWYQGDVPHTPPTNTGNVQIPGDSPTEESQAKLSIVSQITARRVDLYFSGPGAVNGSEVLWGDGSPPEYPGPMGTSPDSRINHTYGAAGTFTFSADPLGPMYGPTTQDFVIAAEDEPDPDPQDEDC